MPVVALLEVVQNVSAGGARRAEGGVRLYAEAGAPERGHAFANVAAGWWGWPAAAGRLRQPGRTDAGDPVAGVPGVREAAELPVLPGQLPGPVGPG